MNHYDQHQSPVAYPPPPTAYPPSGLVYPPPPLSYPPAAEAYAPGPYVVPPPVGYPMKAGPGYSQPPPHHGHGGETSDRGDGFWRGCCAAMCCLCCLDICF